MRIDTRNSVALGLAAGALAVGAAGAVLLLWPGTWTTATGDVELGAVVAPASAAMNARWRF